MKRAGYALLEVALAIIYINITSSPLEEDFEEDTADSDAAA